jgi:adenylylsulfate kinase-like enzyme
MRQSEGVLITGLFRSGKTSVAVEMAHILERRAIPYAVLDLDWLAWGWPARDEDDAEYRMMLRNLGPVVRNFLEAGDRFFIFARAVRHSWELESLRATVRMPLQVVRLVVPWPEIERRLQSDITAGRQDDLREATADVAASEDPILEDLSIANDSPLREVATRILDLLGWL